MIKTKYRDFWLLIAFLDTICAIIICVIFMCFKKWDYAYMAFLSSFVFALAGLQLSNNK